MPTRLAVPFPCAPPSAARAAMMVVSLVVPVGNAQSLVDLGTLGGSTSKALAISDAGDIVGESDTANGNPQGFLRRGCTLLPLSLGGIVNGGSANGINAFGEVAGGSNTMEDFYITAFVFRAGQMQNLGVDGTGQLAFGRSSEAFGINDAGTVVGWRDVEGGGREAFRYSQGVMEGLGGLGGGWSEAYGINDVGRIVGAGRTADGRTRPFQAGPDGVLTDLGTLGGANGEARAINSAGLAVGWSETANGERRPTAWMDGRATDLGDLGGGGEAVAVADDGAVVGWSLTAAGERHAFIYQDGAMADLNESLLPGSGWVLRDARGINSGHRIVGQGASPSGQLHAYLLSPGDPASCPEQAAVPVCRLVPFGRESLKLGRKGYCSADDAVGAAD